MMSLLLSGAVVAVVANASAEPPPTQPFESMDWVASMKTEPTKGLDLGHFRIEFEKTTLSDVRRAVAAGAVDQAGDAAEHSLWLCYTIANHRVPARIWVISDGEMGGDSHVVTGIIATRTKNASPTPNCPALPRKMQHIRFDSPIWLGSTDAQVVSDLGQPSHVEGAWRSFDFRTKVSDDGQCDGGYDMQNWLLTRSDNGSVAAIYAGQTTSC
jgi:hypothetical protein